MWAGIGLASLLAFPVVAWSIWVFVGKQVERAHIRHDGVYLRAKVVDTQHDNLGEGSANDYVYVNVPPCSDYVELPTDNSAAHRVGSRIPVRYDPKSPCQAIALVDEPNGWFDDLFAAFGDGVLLFLAFALFAIGISVIREPRTSIEKGIDDA